MPDFNEVVVDYIMENKFKRKYNIFLTELYHLRLYVTRVSSIFGQRNLYVSYLLHMPLTYNSLVEF